MKEFISDDILLAQRRHNKYCGLYRDDESTSAVFKKKQKALQKYYCTIVSSQEPNHSVLHNSESRRENEGHTALCGKYSVKV